MNVLVKAPVKPLGNLHSLAIVMISSLRNMHNHNSLPGHCEARVMHKEGPLK